MARGCRMQDGHVKKVTIAALLEWAFTSELSRPRRDSNGSGALASSWRANTMMAELGTMIDRSPKRSGFLPDFMDIPEPDSDAVLAGDAVRGLARRGGFDIPGGWNPFPEWEDEHGLISAEVGREVADILARGAANGGQVANLVITCAIMGRGPDWEAEKPEVRTVRRSGREAWFVKRRAKDSFGRWYEYEADGRDPRKKRPCKGAYRKYELETPLRGAIVSRVEWQMWQAALAALTDELSGKLESHELLPFSADMEPWIRPMTQENIPQVIENKG